MAVLSRVLGLRAHVTHVRGALLVAPWVLWLGGADVALSLLLPLKPLAPDLVYRLSSLLASSVWGWVQAIFERANGAVIRVSGESDGDGGDGGSSTGELAAPLLSPLPPGESAIVVANHVSWADFYMIQALAGRAGMLGSCRWFAKSQLRAVPFLGWGLWAMGMPLVSRNWMRDRAELDRVFSGIVNRGWPTWLISFSEATRYTPQKAAESRAWCEQTGRPQPQHLLYPRTKGFVTTVQHLRRAPHVRAVYDLTIAYQRLDGRGGDGDGFQDAPSMWETLRLPDLDRRFNFHVHARRFPLEDLPAEDEELARWLESRWVEKGEWLEEKRQEWARPGDVKE